MKFISFNHDNSEKFGIIENNLITDLTGKIDGASSLKELIKILGENKIKVLKLNKFNPELICEYSVLNAFELFCITNISLD